MSDIMVPLIHRMVWVLSALLLVLGTLVLAFGVGWSVVEAVSAIRLGATGIEHGRDIVATACAVILAGLAAFAVLHRLEADERDLVRLEFAEPVVGYHGRRFSADRWRVEARITVLARRAMESVVRGRADEIARAAAEALALMGPRAAHRPDRKRAEKALAEMANRALGSRVVRSIRIRRLDLTPAL